MTAETIMTQSILALPPDATVRRAIELIEDSEVRHLPILDDGRLVGILSDRDLREYRIPLLESLGEPRATDAAKLLATPVSSVMAANVVSVDRTESIRSVVEALLEYNIGAVPVIDRDTEELVGIVSYTDVLRYTRELLDENE